MKTKRLNSAVGAAVISTDADTEVYFTEPVWARFKGLLGLSDAPRRSNAQA